MGGGLYLVNWTHPLVYISREVLKSSNLGGHLGCVPLDVDLNLGPINGSMVNFTEAMRIFEVVEATRYISEALALPRTL